MATDRINVTAKLQPGQKVTYSGYPGTVMELYADGPCEGGRMYNVCLGSGPVCVCGSDLVPVWTPETARQRVGGTFGT